jgi:hypothetical protein
MIDYVLDAEPGRYELLSGRATLQIKTGFAANHLLVATDSARKAHVIEQDNVDKPMGDWFDGMLRAVPVSVVMAGAALEASANELLTDILDGSARLTLTGSRKRMLEELKGERSGNSTSKYEKLALIMEKEPDLGTEPWYNAKLLVAFRNEFMHFRPTIYVDNVDDERDIVKKLSARLSTSKAYRSQKIQFPYSFMTYECAKWAVQTVLMFCREFAPLLGVQDKLALPGWDFRLP